MTQDQKDRIAMKNGTWHTGGSPTNVVTVLVTSTNAPAAK